jgi:glyoxylase-like metal-dependent hydrolase (beta-lactamase superfamily II)
VEASMGTDLSFYRRIVWGNRKPFKAKPIPERLETKNYAFDVIFSPGHHPFHCVLHEKKQGWLFSGDLYVRQKQHVSYLDENTADVISTLQNILKLDFDTLFCGHAGIQKDGKTKLRIKLDHFESIQKRALELYQEGYSVREISRMLYPKKDLWTIISRGEWSSYNLIRTAIPNRLS